MINIFSENYLAYKIKNSDLYAAVAHGYLREIRQNAAEYRSLDLVPVDRQVSAVMFKKVNEHLFELKHNGCEVFIPVNCLEFDTGDLQLIA